MCLYHLQHKSIESSKQKNSWLTSCACTEKYNKNWELWALGGTKVVIKTITSAREGGAQVK